MWLHGARSTPQRKLRSKLQGRFNYYSVIGNSHMLSEYFNAVHYTVYRVLNSRSHKEELQLGKHQGGVENARHNQSQNLRNLHVT